MLSFCLSSSSSSFFLVWFLSCLQSCLISCDSSSLFVSIYRVCLLSFLLLTCFSFLACFLSCIFFLLFSLCSNWSSLPLLMSAARWLNRIGLNVESQESSFWCGRCRSVSYCSKQCQALHCMLPFFSSFVFFFLLLPFV